eukprot:RCo033179
MVLLCALGLGGRQVLGEVLEVGRELPPVQNHGILQHRGEIQLFEGGRVVRQHHGRQQLLELLRESRRGLQRLLRWQDVHRHNHNAFPFEPIDRVLSDRVVDVGWHIRKGRPHRALDRALDVARDVGDHEQAQGAARADPQLLQVLHRHKHRPLRAPEDRVDEDSQVGEILRDCRDVVLGIRVEISESELAGIRIRFGLVEVAPIKHHLVDVLVVVILCLQLGLHLGRSPLHQVRQRREDVEAAPCDVARSGDADNHRHKESGKALSLHCGADLSQGRLGLRCAGVLLGLLQAGKGVWGAAQGLQTIVQGVEAVDHPSLSGLPPKCDDPGTPSIDHLLVVHQCAPVFHQFLQHGHVVRLPLDDMREEAVRLVGLDLLFGNLLNANDEVAAGEVWVHGGPGGGKLLRGHDPLPRRGLHAKLHRMSLPQLRHHGGHQGDPPLVYALALPPDPHQLLLIRSRLLCVGLSHFRRQNAPSRKSGSTGTDKTRKAHECSKK